MGSTIVDEDGSIEVDVLANDTDSDGSIDATSVAISSAPINGSVSVNTTTGAVTYSGDSDFNGTDQFTPILSLTMMAAPQKRPQSA
jgi:large repetitive protein